MSAASDRANVARRALVCLDLTNLETDCDAAAIDDLCRRAQTPEGSVAAVCVWPRFAGQAKDLLARTGIRVATVVNFPGGDGPIEAVKAETRDALGDGADEIDLVVPWRRLVTGDASAIAATVREIKDVCGDAPLKAILETGELNDPALIALAAEAAIDGGADFLKTSTGKVRVNATPQAAEILLDTIARRSRTVGFKAAGGVRSVADAAGYSALVRDRLGAEALSAARLRFGASGLLGDIERVLSGSAAATAAADAAY